MLKKYNKKLHGIAITVVASICLTGCTYIDDYVFGKDNAPQAKPLPEIKHKKQVDIDWSIDIGSFPKGTAVPDLQPIYHADKIYVATSAGTVMSVNKLTGKTLWRNKLDTPLVAGPVVYSDHVAVNTDHSSISILEKSSGKVVKEVKIASDSIAKPLLIADTMYVKTINGVLYSINIETGKKNWTYNHGSPEIILKASSSPVKYMNHVVVGFSDGELIAFDESNGHVIWQRHIAFPKGASDIERLVDIDTNPIIDGSNMYIATYQGEIGSYSIENSEFNWHRQASTYHDLAVDGDILVMVDSDDVVWAFHKNSGSVLWKQKGLKARGLTAPVIWKHHIIVGDKMGVLHAISLKTGEFIGQLTMPGSIISAPVVEGDACWVLTTNGQLHRLSMRKN
jgi:outer membrane protein assembly factor BamB